MKFSRITCGALCALFMLCCLAFVGSTPAAAQCSPAICNGVPWSNLTMDVELPGHPGCTVRVWYRYRACGIPVSITNIEVWGFSVIGGSPQCDALRTYLYPGGSPDWTAIEWAFREAYNAVVRQSFINTYNGLPPAQRAQFECPNGTAVYSSAWRSCAQILVFHEPTWPWPWPFPWRIELRVCDDELCCIQETRICYDRATGTVQETHSWTYGNYDECKAPPPPPPGAIYWSDCLPWCIE